MPGDTPVKIGFLLWPQTDSWPAIRDAALRAERAGAASLWTWDHLLSIVGPWQGQILEGWSILAGWAQVTERTTLGLMVGANTFRNPGLTAKLATTLDHLSGGRAVLGLGGAWFEREHTAFGIDFGASVGQRLDWLAEAVPAIKTLFEGGEVTSPPGARNSFDHLRINPLPLQAHVPIMIGGEGEKKTLRIVAEHADMWNAFGAPETLAHKDAVLRAYCADVGRDPAAIERTVGCKITIRSTQAEAERAYLDILERNRTRADRMAGIEEVWTGRPERVAEIVIGYRRVGFDTFISEIAAPYDVETLETLIDVVKPLVESVPV